MTQIKNLPQATQADSTTVLVGDIGSRTYKIPITVLFNACAAQMAPVALTDASNIATNAALGTVFSLTLTGNHTLANPTNLMNGVFYTWIITQDGSGGHTLAYGSMFKWPGGSAPTVTATAGAVSVITAQYLSSTNVLNANSALNFS